MAKLNFSKIPQKALSIKTPEKNITDYKIFFSEVANNYSGGTKSFKKAMKNLDTSSRNIADNNIHSQIRAKEILPTSNQIDFSQELDLLLSEIIRIAK